jgi:hypothetical protein
MESNDALDECRSSSLNRHHKETAMQDTSLVQLHEGNANPQSDMDELSQEQFNE